MTYRLSGIEQFNLKLDRICLFFSILIQCDKANDGANQLSTTLVREINIHLAENGMVLREGTIIDATTISAPTSTSPLNADLGQ
ncbi:hypothetical protein ACJJIP_10240 [Microbulbifer sp. VTAC004]|uniref:hypothetical protein n=1 Tax=Microbulbifer sp. VTAC004 TaxID=3243386 RepID=UPI00403A18A8